MTESLISVMVTFICCIEDLISAISFLDAVTNNFENKLTFKSPPFCISTSLTVRYSIQIQNESFY